MVPALSGPPRHRRQPRLYAPSSAMTGSPAPSSAVTGRPLFPVQPRSDSPCSKSSRPPSRVSIFLDGLSRTSPAAKACWSTVGFVSSPASVPSRSSSMASHGRPRPSSSLPPPARLRLPNASRQLRPNSRDVHGSTLPAHPKLWLQSQGGGQWISWREEAMAPRVMIAHAVSGPWDIFHRMMSCIHLLVRDHQGARQPPNFHHLFSLPLSFSPIDHDFTPMALDFLPTASSIPASHQIQEHGRESPTPPAPAASPSRTLSQRRPPALLQAKLPRRSPVIHGGPELPRRPPSPDHSSQPQPDVGLPALSQAPTFGT